MELSIRDVARLLQVSEDTVFRWAREHELPAHRANGEYRFNRVELQEWATHKGLPVSPELFAPRGLVRLLPSLRGAIERGGVYHDIPGGARESVLYAVTRVPGIPATIPRERLYDLLVSREALASTGVGDGIAIPHPRDPLVVRVDEPVILLCFLEQSVDFSALDGAPIRVLFVSLAPSIHTHLQMLSRIAHALHDSRFRDLLGARAPADEILRDAGRLDEALGSRNVTPPELP
ncbi:MAG: PTS sugar transporter subunit IIA [Polyangiaceae bacterium]